MSSERPPSLASNFEEIIAGAALIIVVLSVCWGVVTRYITEQPAAWAGEIAAMAFAWLVFIGASAALKRSMHVSIDMVVQALPPGAQRIVMALAGLVVVVFLIVATALAAEFAVDTLDNPSSVLRIPLSVIYAPVVIGFACLLLRYIQAAWPRYRGTAAGER
jgi:TRAP-type C4-dicarboxylate transport system permease small subunit